MLIQLIATFAAVQTPPPLPRTAPEVCIDVLETPEGQTYLKTDTGLGDAVASGVGVKEALDKGRRRLKALEARWRAMGAHLELKNLDETCRAVLQAWIEGARYQLGETPMPFPAKQ